MDNHTNTANKEERADLEDEDYVTIIEGGDSDKDDDSDDNIYESIKLTEHIYTKLPKQEDDIPPKTNTSNTEKLQDDKPTNKTGEPTKILGSAGFLDTFVPGAYTMDPSVLANHYWMMQRNALLTPAYNGYSAAGWNFGVLPNAILVAPHAYSYQNPFLQNSNAVFPQTYNRKPILNMNHKCEPGISLLTVFKTGIAYVHKSTNQNLLCVNIGSPMTQKPSFVADGIGVTALALGFDFVFTLRLYHERLECVRYDIELKNEEVLFRMEKKKTDLCLESLEVMNNKQLLTMCNKKGKITAEFYNFNGMHMASLKLPSVMTSGRILCLRDNSIVLYSNVTFNITTYVYTPKDVEATIRGSSSRMKYQCVATDEQGLIYGVGVEGDTGRVAARVCLYIMAENWSVMYKCPLPSLDADTRLVSRLRVRYGWVTVECRPRGSFVFRLS